MKTAVKIATCVMLVSFAFGQTAFSKQMISVFDKGRAIAPAAAPEVEPPPLYSFVPDTGVPVVITETRVRAALPAVVTYSGEKKIPFEVAEKGTAVRVATNNPGFAVRYAADFITIENNNLPPGESATLTITVTPPGGEPITENVNICVTDGTQGQPHLITSLSDLLLIRELGLDKHYVQMCDIDLAGIKEWTPIGDEKTPFTGVYDGNGFLIDNMKFQTISTNFPALFGVVKGGFGAKITDVHVKGDINTTLYPINAHGSIVGVLDNATIENSSFTGNMSFGRGAMTAGGILALSLNNAVVTNCTYDGEIVSSSINAFIGGVAGNFMGAMSGCATSGTIRLEGTGSAIGGLVGRNTGTITNTSSTASVLSYGTNGRAGGIAGVNASQITGSKYSGNILLKGENATAGGIAGVNSGDITGVTADGVMTFDGAYSVVGGIAGQNADGSIEKCSSGMNISGTGKYSYIGGITGENYAALTQTNERLDRSIVSVVENNIFYGDIAVKGGDCFIGGVVGRNYLIMMVLSNVPGKVQAIVENNAVTSKSITGTTAAAVTGISEATGLGASSNAYFINVGNNSVLNSVLVNGTHVTNADSGTNVLNSAQMESFLDSNGIKKTDS